MERGILSVSCQPIIREIIQSCQGCEVSYCARFAQHVTLCRSRDCEYDFPDCADIKPIKALAMSLMAVNTAQSFLSTAWHPVPQTPLIIVCKLKVQTYRVSHSD